MATYNIEEGGLAWRYNHSRAKVQVFGGGFGNGKTSALCIKSIQLADDYPGSNGLLARETYPKTNDTLRKEFYKWIPKAVVRRWPTKDDNTMYLHNGTTINFRYIAQRGKTSEDGQTTSNLLSATYDWAGVDQVEDPGIIEKDFLDIMGRLRGTTPYRGLDGTMPRSGPRWLLLTCNPTSNWFYRRVIKPLHLYLHKGIKSEGLMLNPRTGLPLVELFEGSTYENRANLPDDFLAGLEASYSGQMRERFLMGKWAAYEGLVYPQFQVESHMLPHGEMLSYLSRLVKEKNIRVLALEGYDFGMSSPSCYLLAFIDNYSRVFVIDGFYKKEMRLDEQASEIKLLRERYSDLIAFGDPIIADPAIFRRKTMPGYKILGTTISQKFDSDFRIKMRPGDNSIDAGIMKVGSYLNLYPRIPHPLYPVEKSSLIYFSDKLDFIMEEFGNYFWKRNPQGDMEDQPIDRNDHSLDTIKYMLSFRPKPGEIVTPQDEQVPAYMFWHEGADEAREARRF